LRVILQTQRAERPWVVYLRRPAGRRPRFDVCRAHEGTHEIFRPWIFQVVK